MTKPHSLSRRNFHTHTNTLYHTLSYTLPYILSHFLSYTISHICTYMTLPTGGTASNLVTMIAGADIALSVLMTAVSTVAAVVMTPLLTSWLAGSYVTVKASDLVLSTLQVVLTPILAGLTINTVAPTLSSAVSQYTPFLSVLLVSTICGTISASNSAVKIGNTFHTLFQTPFPTIFSCTLSHPLIWLLTNLPQIPLW